MPDRARSYGEGVFKSSIAMEGPPRRSASSARAWADSESDKCVLREAPFQIVRALATTTHPLRRPEPMRRHTLHPGSWTVQVPPSPSAALRPHFQRTPPAPPRWIRTERTSDAPAGPDRRRGLTSRIVKNCIQKLVPKTRKSLQYLDYASIAMNNLFFRRPPRSV